MSRRSDSWWYIEGGEPPPPTAEVTYDSVPPVGSDDSVTVPTATDPGIRVPTATWIKSGSHRE